LESDIDPAARDRLVRIKLDVGVASLLVMLGRAQEQDGVYRIAWPAEGIAFYQSSNVCRSPSIGASLDADLRQHVGGRVGHDTK
jgi:hypothetical protein